MKTAEQLKHEIEMIYTLQTSIHQVAKALALAEGMDCYAPYIYGAEFPAGATIEHDPDGPDRVNFNSDDVVIVYAPNWVRFIREAVRLFHN